MAARGSDLEPEMLDCLICLDLLKDPVVIPCGHSYCMSCVRHVWDEEVKLHSCPRCARTFPSRPVQLRNTTLADLLEPLEETELRDDRSYAGLRDVACDVCAGRKGKALESCLASCCEKHLQPHHESPTLERHSLVSLTDKLESVSSRGCQGCARDERAERRPALEASRRAIRRRIQSRETDVRVLRLEAEALDRSADKAADASEEIFAGLISAIERRSREVTARIRSRQRAEVSRVAALRDKLEEEIADLRRKDAELEQLSNAVDETDSLRRKSSLAGSTDSPSSYTRPPRFLEDVTSAVSEARDKLQKVLQEEWAKISRTVSGSTAPEPATRAELLRYSRRITLDPDTAHTRVLLSEGNRKATLAKETQLYCWHPDRFLERWQVLSGEGLTGRCYWEVKRSGVEVFIAVAYKDIGRSGAFDVCAFGKNAKSWGLASYKNGYQFKHANVNTPVSGPPSSRIGVYLDHSAGVLSFYSISETTTLLHRVQTTFTQPLYAGFWLPNTKGDAVELC
ncbi:tripartite motif-containing protein 16-like protein [Clinocottus analis]|uniref:tripartite motif-containing protein 16-like protein n=1 Tax=Clinocottus analis TaxID=304258 RepID=UPI0035C223F4